jgi:hypothetical protein
LDKIHDRRPELCAGSEWANLAIAEDAAAAAPLAKKLRRFTFGSIEV